MGANASTQLEKELVNGGEQSLPNEHYYGLVNFGNTCYCNSVIQALYFCRPFREKILAYKQSNMKKSGGQKDNLLVCLADLFSNIASQKRRVGTIAPKRFVTKLKRENELFDNFLQQDAHEFLNYLLNAISETLAEERRQTKETTNSLPNGLLAKSGTLSKRTTPAPPPMPASSLPHSGNSLPPQSSLPSTSTADCSTTTTLLPSMAGDGSGKPEISSANSTWIQEIFQGTLTNETRCLNCEQVSSKDEDFLDLSVDIEQNVSISHCLRNFSNMEELGGEQKYHCENCNSKQEAQKRMGIKKLPTLLALHLKRFKYVDQLNRYTKLSYRVPFPMELRLFNVRDDAPNSDLLYDLCAVVVHCGSTPNRGHYITLVKSNSFWLLFDDDIVDKVVCNEWQSYVVDFDSFQSCFTQQQSFQMCKKIPNPPTSFSTKLETLHRRRVSGRPHHY